MGYPSLGVWELSGDLQMIVVTGASGLLGRQVFKALGADHDVIGTAYSRCEPPLVKLDLLDELAITSFFTHHKPSFVVHCAVERRPDVASKDQARATRLNAGTTEMLAKLR
jgi:S-adenosylmethionine synthetase